MRVEKRDGAVSRKVLTAMLVDDTVCGRIAAAWQDGAFPDRWSNVVAAWAVEYHRKYDCAPGKNVEGLFAAWAPTADKESAKLVEAYLTSLNGEYAKLKRGVNPDFVTDQANTLFEKARLERLAEQIQGDVAAGDVQKARRRIELSKPVEVGADAPVDVLGDPTALKAAFRNKAKPLFTLPGAAGNFFGKHLCRDGFIAFMGQEKIGKSWWLQEMGWQAMMQGCNVAWFACGDMSRDQMLMRMACRAARTPIDDAPYRYPKGIEPSGGAKETTADLEDRTPLGPLTYKKAKAKLDKLGAKYGKDRIKLAAYPNDTVTVPQLDAHLKRWEANYGWTADVVVIDYADILAPINGQADTRDQINATWKRLRALSQSRHCLVVTATQVKASGYKKELLDKSDFADDKRKFAHVTGMVAINQKGEEKDHQIQRLNWTVLREGEFSESKCLFVAGCFAIANPLVQSTF